jgi:hypothetical protein
MSRKEKVPEPNPFEVPLQIPFMYRMEAIAVPRANNDGKLYEIRRMEVSNRATLYLDLVMPLFQELTGAAKDMVMYIAQHLRWDTDYLELREDRYCEDMGVTRATFFAAKSQLVNRLIIPRTSRRHTYWINPALLYKGNRLHRYPDRAVPVNDHPFERLSGTSVPKDDAVSTQA